jgi:hypothetical protein
MTHQPKFKTGDIVRYVEQPPWTQYVTAGSVLEVVVIGEFFPPQQYQCRLLLGNKTDRAPEGRDTLMFVELELEAIHEVQNR